MSLFLLDTTVLIAHVRGHPVVTGLLQRLLSEGHTLGTSCVNLAEIERGIRPGERSRASRLLDGLRFLPTSRDAAIRAGKYQADFDRQGRTIHTADALVAGTASYHQAILLTDNVRDFPMTDIRVQAPPASG
ncbi:MAG: PIN domain-containing protein [Chloroflexi bacterium]|nr:PIN domain-containing protein [Chloroflexota bacterium]